MLFRGVELLFVLCSIYSGQLAQVQMVSEIKHNLTGLIVKLPEALSFPANQIGEAWFIANNSDLAKAALACPGKYYSVNLVGLFKQQGHVLALIS